MMDRGRLRGKGPGSTAVHNTPETPLPELSTAGTVAGLAVLAQPFETVIQLSNSPLSFQFGTASIDKMPFAVITLDHANSSPLNFNNGCVFYFEADCKLNRKISKMNYLLLDKKLSQYMFTGTIL
jgi:hypothetical protein